MARKKTPQQQTIALFMSTDRPVELLNLAQEIVKQRFPKSRKPKATKKIERNGSGSTFLPA